MVFGSQNEINSLMERVKDKPPLQVFQLIQQLNALLDEKVKSGIELTKEEQKYVEQVSPKPSKFKYLLILVALIVVGYIFYFFATNVNRHAEKTKPIIERFLNDYNQADLKNAALLFRNENPLVPTEKNTPLDELEAFFNQVRQHYGKVISLENAGYEYAYDTEFGNELVIYKVGTFENGKGSIDFIFNIIDSNVHFRRVAFGGELAKKLMKKQ